MGESGPRAARGSRTRRRGRRWLSPGSVLDFASWLIPPALGLSLGRHLATASAGLIGSVGGPFVPRMVHEYPRRVGDLFGQRLSHSDARRLMRERLAFLIARQLASHALATGRGRRQLWEQLEVRGLEHLEAARAQGQGVMLVTTHFGLPFLIRVVLPRLGIRQVQAELGDEAGGRNVAVSGGALERLAALKRFRAALVGGAACVLLADGRIGAPIQMSFFERDTTITLGAFYLGHLAQCAILPYFGVMPGDRARLCVEISPALELPKGSSPEDLAAMAEGFFGVYRDYARRYPSHLPYRLIRDRRH
jgi:lauroyl/myristoyl acyltransferase